MKDIRRIALTVFCEEKDVRDFKEELKDFILEGTYYYVVKGSIRESDPTDREYKQCVKHFDSPKVKLFNEDGE